MVKPLKAPRRATVARLFAVSMNRCAFPGCFAPLISTTGVVIGQVAHVKAQNVGGLRYDAGQTSEQPKGFDNLILVCAVRHIEIDARTNLTTYTVERFCAIKQVQEEEAARSNQRVPELSGSMINRLIQELLVAGWKAAAELDPSVRLPTDETLIRTRVLVQTILHVLARQRLFAGLAMHAVIGDPKQVLRHLIEPELRQQSQDCVRTLITEDTRGLVTHSRGSVVVYEALGSMPGHPVRTLVTFGSPLGIPNLILDRLHPAPIGGVGVWPGGAELVGGTDIAYSGDIVAFAKQLDPVFGREFTHRVWDTVAHNSAKSHDSALYMIDELTGRAINDGRHAH
ncbi:hypothetical protein [Nocardia abscessus]|uniref:hypothetical protein n=1 Tax=Nocardia abscessus TaxID=120957 RepID=UPI00245428FC|nr:hypothetical protein [Nocardia abscessus]